MSSFWCWLHKFYITQHHPTSLPFLFILWFISFFSRKVLQKKSSFLHVPSLWTFSNTQSLKVFTGFFWIFFSSSRSGWTTCCNLLWSPTASLSVPSYVAAKSYAMSRLPTRSYGRCKTWTWHLIESWKPKKHKQSRRSFGWGLVPRESYDFWGLIFLKAERLGLKYWFSQETS